MVSTEGKLREWRDGSTKAERLCAAILAIEGFSNIDPQSPLGGADDRKDIVAHRGMQKWIAAVYFPSMDKSFTEVNAKFTDDLEGVSANGAHAFAFLTNQHLTLGQREELRQLADVHTEIYHRERLRAVLDSP